MAEALWHSLRLLLTFHLRVRRRIICFRWSWTGSLSHDNVDGWMSGTGVDSWGHLIVSDSGWRRVTEPKESETNTARLLARRQRFQETLDVAGLKSQHSGWQISHHQRWRGRGCFLGQKVSKPVQQHRVALTTELACHVIPQPRQWQLPLLTRLIDRGYPSYPPTGSLWRGKQEVTEACVPKG